MGYLILFLTLKNIIIFTECLNHNIYCMKIGIDYVMIKETSGAWHCILRQIAGSSSFKHKQILQ